MTVQHKADRISELLFKKYPQVTPPLHHRSAWELLVATILSAQSTDARVNTVTPKLFARYPTIHDVANADIEELKEIIRINGLFNSKAKNIIAAARKIIDEFGGEVPNNMTHLITIPGAAKKTASVVLWQWYGINEGFTVDTHVMRLANWFGLTKHQEANKISQDLEKLFSREKWGDISLRLILLGRELLTARNPKYQGTEWEELVAIPVNLS